MKLRTLCKARRDQFLIRFSCLKPSLLSSSHLTSRREKGQAIAGGSAVMVLIVTVAVGLIALYFNIYVVGQNQYKANLVAEETLRSLQPDLYWLNCVHRQDFNPDSATAKATTVARSLALQLDMPSPVSIVVFEAPIGPGPNFDQGSTLTVKVNFPAFSLPFQIGGLFPSFFQVTGTGVLSSNDVSKPYLVMHVNALNRDGWPNGGNLNPTEAFTSICPVYGYMMGDASTATNHNMDGMPPALPPGSSVYGGPYDGHAMIGYSGFEAIIKAHPGYYDTSAP